jgi:Methylase involved in ubiquinone/menaquinone biosynthesis
MDDPVTPRGIRRTYMQIAAHFAETRTAPWPAVEAFCADTEPMDVAVDLGCGNGRHLPLLDAVAARPVGVDLTRALLEQADTQTPLLEADARALPFADHTVDLLVAVAMVHHLRPADRARVYAECARILAPDAEGLISVWAVDHPRFDATSGFDAMIPWTRQDGVSIDRFYHIFDAGEFRSELSASPLRVQEVFIEAGNLFAVVEG